MRSALPVVLALSCLAGCSQERNRWTEAEAKAAEAAPQPAASATDGGGVNDKSAKRIMLFAPTDIGPLVAIYPAARLDFPHSMAQKVDVLMRESDGRVGELLPDSGAPRWDEGRVPATAGVHVVVLSRILELRVKKGQPGVTSRPDRVEAIVEVRALNVDGKTVWRKRAGAEADVPTSPKTLTASARPESRAAYDALDAGLGALRSWLATQSDLVARPASATDESAPAAAALIEVEIDSEPARADIFIDGVFRGNTPQKLRLPPRPLAVRIERKGYVTWEQPQVKPEPGMRIQPALQPIAVPAAPAAPVAPPAAETAPTPSAPAATEAAPTEPPVVPAQPVAPAPGG